MAMDKSLYEAPEGEMGLDAELAIEIEADDSAMPLVVEMDDGSVEITYGEEAESEIGMSVPFDVNLAEYIDENELMLIANDLKDAYDKDVQSREEWCGTFIAGLDVIGFKYEERTEPWDKACGAYSSVLAEAAIRFQAESMSETFPAAGPVKTKILGEETPEKREAAERVRVDMNNELTEVMTEYRPEHERMLFSLGLMGSAFKKIYYDAEKERQVALYISAEDLVMPFGASNIESAERVTHVMRKTKYEMLSAMNSGFYLNVDLGEPEKFTSDLADKKANQEGFELNEDDRYAIYEIHTRLDLDEYLGDGTGFGDSDDGLPKPYVVTVEHGTNRILSIYRNWKEGDLKATPVQHFVQYNYVPGFGSYGLGLIHIIGGYAKAGTSLIRQLVDSGSLANLQGGFKTRGMRVLGDDTPIGPGEWRDVDSPNGSALKDNMLPLPYKEPSATLLNLLDRITSDARRLAAINDIDISDMSANAPVGTTLALLERVLKPQTAVQSRIHYSMKQEFKILKRLIAEHAPESYSYVPHKGVVAARRADYEMVDVIPVSDPNASTMAQRVVQYQAALEMASRAPQIYDLPQLHRQMLEVLGIKNVEKVIPTAADQNPKDPVSENMDALVGKPTKAFIYQDHEAHIATHTSFMQDPSVMQLIGQNPMAQQIMGALQAHIAEHVAFKYRRDIEVKLGVQLPPPGERLSEEMETAISQVMADAGRQMSQENQQRAAQQQAQQQMQDPNIQLQQAEQQRKQHKDMMDFQLKQGELQRKMAKDEVDARVKAKELTLEEAAMIIQQRNQEIDRNNQRFKEMLGMIQGGSDANSI